MVRRLGEPTCSGPLKVGPNGDQPGSYAEWGSARLTWNGRPTVTFWPGGKVLCTIGHSLTLPDGVLALGLTRQEIEARLGPPDPDESPGTLDEVSATCIYLRSGQKLHLTYDGHGRLIRILRESTDRP